MDDEQQCKKIEKELRQLLFLKQDPQQHEGGVAGAAAATPSTTAKGAFNSAPNRVHNDRNVVYRNNDNNATTCLPNPRKQQDKASSGRCCGKTSCDSRACQRPRSKGSEVPRRNASGGAAMTPIANEGARKPTTTTDNQKQLDEGASCSYQPSKAGEAAGRAKKTQWQQVPRANRKPRDDEQQHHQDANAKPERGRTESPDESVDGEYGRNEYGKTKMKKKKKRKERKFTPLTDAIEVKMNNSESRMNDINTSLRSLSSSQGSDVVTPPRQVYMLNRDSPSQRHGEVHQMAVDKGNKVKPRVIEDTSDILEDNKCSPQELARLEQDYIYPLKKKMTKHPRALFFCRLCDYHCDNIQVCNKHIKDNRHQRNKSSRELDITLQNIPNPTKCQTDCITELLEGVVREQALTEKEIGRRKKLVGKLNDAVQEKLNNCKLQIYGSTLSKFGLKSSDLNVDLVISDKENPSKMLLAVCEILKEEFGSVESDFTAKIPSIYYTERDTGLRCVICLNNQLAQKTTSLLAAYVDMDPRVKTLAIAFRHWAKLCMIDEQVKGTLPSYSYALLLIYFLQQHPQPVLPVLHEVSGGVENNVEKFKEAIKNWECKNKKSVGELWVELFKFYSVKLKLTEIVISIRLKKVVSRGEKNWSSKKIAIEDPFSPKRNIASSISNVIVFDYIFERFKMTYKYFGIPRTRNGALFDKLLTTTKYEVDCEYSPNMNESLFLKVLDNLSGQKKTETDKVVAKDDNSERDLVKRTKELGLSCGKPRVIEDSSSKKVERKIEKNEINASVKQETAEEMDDESLPKEKPYLLDFLSALDGSTDDLDSERSESTPRCGEDDSEQENCIPMSLMEALDDGAEASSLSGTEGGTGNCHSPDKNLGVSVDGQHSDRETPKTSISMDVAEDDDDDDNDDDDDDDNQSEGKSDDKNREANAAETDLEKMEVTKSELLKIKDSLNDDRKALPFELRKQLETFTREDFFYQFYQLIFTNGKAPAVICALCQKTGHLKQNCPDEVLPPLEPLDRMTDSFRNALDEICDEIFRSHAPTDSRIKEREQILANLQEFIRQTYEGAHLELFGSSCNGFGFANSDLDICLTFEDEKMVCKEGCVEIIENLARKFKKHKSLYNVIAITTAKVPIVKFIHRPTKLEGDISLYNTLAQHNTRMLRLYSQLDRRVQVLGYTMKYFAKICDIGDASRGSLSSYAYILMILYYLQQRNPPVIPVLQELYDQSETQPKNMVDGWNAWFCEEDDVRNKWSHFGENKESIGELWLGLLRFYTEEFKFQEYVISTRQLKPLTRFEKLWNSKCIAIEDPFDLDHNLGAGVSRKMNSYIMKALIRGRNIFGRPPLFIEYDRLKLQVFLFNAERLTEGNPPPNDRGCRICGKIGHIMKDCPHKRDRHRDKDNNGRDADMGREHSNRNMRKDPHPADLGMRPGRFNHDPYHPHYYPSPGHIKGQMPPIPLGQLLQAGLYPRQLPPNVRSQNMRMSGPPVHPMGNFSRPGERSFPPSRFADNNGGNVRPDLVPTSHMPFGNKPNDIGLGRGKPIKTMIVANKTLAEREARDPHSGTNSSQFQSSLVSGSSKNHPRLPVNAEQAAGSFRKLDKPHPSVSVHGLESENRSNLSAKQLSASASTPSLPLNVITENAKPLPPPTNDGKHVYPLMQVPVNEQLMLSSNLANPKQFVGHSLVNMDGNLAVTGSSQGKMPIGGMFPPQRRDAKMLPIPSQMLLVNQGSPQPMSNLSSGMNVPNVSFLQQQQQQQSMSISHQGPEQEQTSADYMMQHKQQMPMFAKYPSATSCNTVIALPPNQPPALFPNRPAIPFSPQFAGYQVRSSREPNGYPLYQLIGANNQMSGLQMPSPMHPQHSMMQQQQQQQHLQQSQQLQQQKKIQTPPPPPPAVQNVGKFVPPGKHLGSSRTYAQAASQMQPSSKSAVPGFKLGMNLHDAAVPDRPFENKKPGTSGSRSLEHQTPFRHPSVHSADKLSFTQTSVITNNQFINVQTHAGLPPGNNALFSRPNPEGD